MGRRGLDDNVATGLLSLNNCADLTYSSRGQMKKLVKNGTLIEITVFASDSLYCPISLFNAVLQFQRKTEIVFDKRLAVAAENRAKTLGIPLEDALKLVQKIHEDPDVMKLFKFISIQPKPRKQKLALISNLIELSDVQPSLKLEQQDLVAEVQSLAPLYVAPIKTDEEGVGVF